MHYLAHYARHYGFLVAVWGCEAVTFFSRRGRGVGVNGLYQIGSVKNATGLIVAGSQVQK